MSRKKMVMIMMILMGHLMCHITLCLGRNLIYSSLSGGSHQSETDWSNGERGKSTASPLFHAVTVPRASTQLCYKHTKTNTEELCSWLFIAQLINRTYVSIMRTGSGQLCRCMQDIQATLYYYIYSWTRCSDNNRSQIMLYQNVVSEEYRYVSSRDIHLNPQL